MKRSDWLKEPSTNKRCKLFWPNNVLGKILIYNRLDEKILSIEAFDSTGLPKHTHVLEWAFLKDNNYTLKRALQFWETERLCCFYTSRTTSGLWSNEIGEIVLPPAISGSNNIGDTAYCDSMPKTWDEVVNTIEVRRQAVRFNGVLRGGYTPPGIYMTNQTITITGSSNIDISNLLISGNSLSQSASLAGGHYGGSWVDGIWTHPSGASANTESATYSNTITYNFRYEIEDVED